MPQGRLGSTTAESLTTFPPLPKL
ncbi:hypothetical protein LINPERHAP1_LOCUS13453 [Linum perenne]